MTNEKIRTYGELNLDEQEVIDSFRKIKLLWDQARFELFSYKLTDLLKNYEGLLEQRKETQAALFEVLEEIAAHDLSGIDVDFEKLGRNRQVEANNIAEEVNIISEYKVAFDEALVLISSGQAEELMVDAENNW